MTAVTRDKVPAVCAANGGEREDGCLLRPAGLADFERQPIAGKCASCRFWRPDDEPQWLDCASSIGWHVPRAVDYAGCCHRRAPLPLAVVEPGWKDNRYSGNNAAWPRTRWGDFCGEHERGRDVMPFTEEGGS